MYELDLTMKGTTNELEDMLSAYARYHKEVMDLDVLELLESDDIKQGCKQGEVSLVSEYLNCLDHLNLFAALADAAPSAYISIDMTGRGKYEEESLKGELKDGIMNIDHCIKNFDNSELWCDFFVEKIPYEEFVKLFKLSCDEDSYLGLVEDLYSYTCFNDLSYDDFLYLLEEYEGETELDEEEYTKVIDKKLKKYGIDSDTWFDDYIEGDTMLYSYNPITRKWT